PRRPRRDTRPACTDTPPPAPSRCAPQARQSCRGNGPSTPPRRRKGRVQLQPWPDLLSLSSGGLQGLQAGNNVVVLRLSAEAIRAIRARVALVALGALRAVLAVSTSGATRPIRARVTLVALVALRALRSLSRTSRLNPVQLSRRDRRAPSLPVLPLIRL